MGQLVKVKIRPGGALQFPGICVHCTRPAAERMRLRKRTGRLTRLIDVPLCTVCYRELGRRSGEEERWLRLSRVGAVAGALIVLALIMIFLNASFSLWLSALLASPPAILAAIGIWSIAKKRSLKSALPEKQAILASAGMIDFSWRATTFEFENLDFFESFTELNRSYLMDI